MMTVTKVAYAATALFMGPVLALPVGAAYPEKVVRVIVPWPPGPTDVIARVVTAELGPRLKQSVIVDNRAGAGGIVGMQAVAQSPPDGYTLNSENSWCPKPPNG